MKKYLNELANALKSKGFSQAEIDEILADHSEMIESAIEEGLSEDAIESKFGSPDAVAADLKEMGMKEEPKIEDAKDFKTVSTFNIDQEEINVEIKLVNDDYTVERTDGNQIEVLVKGRYNPDDFRFTFQNGSFQAEMKSKIKGFTLHFGSSPEFLFRIPNVFIKNMNLVSVSGDVSVDSIRGGRFEMKSTNGDVQLSSLDLDTFKMDSVNGDVKIQTIIANSSSMSSVSGDVKIDKMVLSGDLFVNNVSGDFTVTNSSCEECAFKTVSGDVSGQEFYPKRIRLHSISGDISIVNKNRTSHIEIIERKSLSGSIKIVNV
ncbi:MAG: DUF4097 family beta strand repeat-containing protein [Candidatus Izemoplasmatales bacterium]|nr:DUF4097 family beta strand repeat-containing protein [Candidatus Izemoplasmatales bacterium]